MFKEFRWPKNMDKLLSECPVNFTGLSSDDEVTGSGFVMNNNRLNNIWSKFKSFKVYRILSMFIYMPLPGIEPRLLQWYAPVICSKSDFQNF